MFKYRCFTLDIVLFSSLQRLLWAISHLGLLHSSDISAVNSSVGSLWHLDNIFKYRHGSNKTSAHIDSGASVFTDGKV